MVRDAILAAFFHRFLPVTVLSDASASMTSCGAKFFPKLSPNVADGLTMNADGLPDLGIAAAGLDETDHRFPTRRGQPLRSLAHGPVTEHFALPAAVTARSAATTTAAAPVQVPPGAARSACNSA
jgi:hypothetical protein